MTSQVVLDLNGLKIRCRLATTPAEHSIGLQRTAGLAPDEGLLFLFPSESYRTFHTGSVRFPFEILFLRQGKIARIVENIQPGFEETWGSRCDSVLEVKAGTCRNGAIRIGDVLTSVPNGKSAARRVGVDSTSNEWHQNLQDIKKRDDRDDTGSSGRGHATPDEVTSSSPAMYDESKKEYFENLWGDELANEALDVRPELQTRHGQIVDDVRHRVVEWIASFGDPLTLYREVYAHGQDDINLNSPGVFWTPLLTKAHSPYGYADKKGQPFILTAKVPRSSVDVDGTVAAMRRWPDEYEIRILPSAKIDVVSIQPRARKTAMDVGEGQQALARLDERLTLLHTILEEGKPVSNVGGLVLDALAQLDKYLTGKQRQSQHDAAGLQRLLAGEPWHVHLSDGGYSRITLDPLELPHVRFDHTLSLPRAVERWNSLTQHRSAQIVDDQKFVSKVAPILLVHADRIPWQKDALNGGATERAVVSRTDLAQWLSGGPTDGLDSTEGAAAPEATQAILEASSTDQGLRLIGTAYQLSGICGFYRAGFKGRLPSIVLYRAPRDEKDGEDEEA